MRATAEIIISRLYNMRCRTQRRKEIEDNQTTIQGNRTGKKNIRRNKLVRLQI